MDLWQLIANDHAHIADVCGEIPRAFPDATSGAGSACSVGSTPSCGGTLRPKRRAPMAARSLPRACYWEPLLARQPEALAFAA